ncbi:hypothetical protein VTK26DRAFT_6054 [Humicola hyalothermophila]
MFSETTTRLATLRPAVRLGTTRTARCLSTTTLRSLATPTGRQPPKDPHSQPPVDDIDLVFDYPTEGQASYQKQPLEQSGLDLHSAMPHHQPQGPAKAAGDAMRSAGQSMPSGAGRLGKEVGSGEGNNMLYFGIGALGLGGLYMMMRRPRHEADSSGSRTRPAMRAPPDLGAQRATEAKFRSNRAG